MHEGSAASSSQLELGPNCRLKSARYKLRELPLSPPSLHIPPKHSSRNRQLIHSSLGRKATIRPKSENLYTVLSPTSLGLLPQRPACIGSEYWIVRTGSKIADVVEEYGLEGCQCFTTDGGSYHTGNRIGDLVG